MASAARTAAVLLAAATAACAAPSRQLSSRVVEDPIVVPARMAALSVTGYLTHYEPTGERVTGMPAGFRYGLTDRLEWVDLLSLRYAFLDDRPVDGRPARPVSLAVRAGLRGGGYSTLNGIIVVPVASVDLLKRIGDRWALTAAAGWDAVWTQRRAAIAPTTTSPLDLTPHQAMAFVLRGAAVRQLGAHVALGVFGAGVQQAECADGCRRLAWGMTGGLMTTVRPWRWLTLGAAAAAGLRVREDPASIPGPDDTVSIPPRQVEYVRLSGSATFYW